MWRTAVRRARSRVRKARMEQRMPPAQPACRSAMNDTRHPEATNPLNESPVVPLVTTGAKPAVEEEARFREVTGWVKGLFVVLTLPAIFLAVNQLFNLRLFVGVVIIENRYLYLLAGIFLALAFAAFPISPRARGGPTPWYDLILAALSLGACGY